MLMQKTTPEQLLQRCCLDIISHERYKYLTSVMMVGRKKVVETQDVPTAMTNGRDVFFNRKYLEELTMPEKRYLVLHEEYHKLFCDLNVWAELCKKDPQVANQALDHHNNLILNKENKDDGFAVMPKGGLADERFTDMSVKQIFDTLYEEKHGNGKGKGDGEGECEGDEEDDESGSGSTSGEVQDDNGETLDGHDWEGAEELTPEEQEELKETLEEALREGIKMAGEQGGSVNETIADLLKPKVDWKKVTRSFATEHTTGHDFGTYARPNRRFIGSGIYLPSPMSITVPELGVHMDTSGSCWSVLPYFFAETKSIAKSLMPHKLHVTFWDTDVVYEKFEHNQLDGFEIKEAYGGGGTDVRCVPNYLREHKIKPTASIVLTDGYLSGGWGKWDHPVLWLIVDNPKARPPVGKYIHVDSADFK